MRHDQAASPAPPRHLQSGHLRGPAVAKRRRPGASSTGKLGVRAAQARHYLIFSVRSSIVVEPHGDFTSPSNGANVTPEEIERLAFAYLPDGFLRGVLQAVYTSHDVARQDCFANFAATEADNLLGYYRRAKLEGLLRDVTERHSGITAAVAKADKSGWNHTEIRSGPVVLTQNSVQSPCALVDKAEFRCTLAEHSQLTFWPEDRPADATLYGLLLHSRSVWEAPEQYAKYAHLPGSAYLAFPSPSLDAYVHVVNLFEKFPDVVSANMPDDLDGEARVRYVRRASRTGVG